MHYNTRARGSNGTKVDFLSFEKKSPKKKTTTQNAISAPAVLLRTHGAPGEIPAKYLEDQRCSLEMITERKYTGEKKKKETR